jgi:hypothetical protein
MSAVNKPVAGITGYQFNPDIGADERLLASHGRNP